ncbi:MAG: sigma-54-dependent transcriptional regulator [Myxococcales bacterium]
MSENDVRKANILVVDDEEDHAQVMCEALTRQGHKCDVTYNLAEASAKLDRRPYDVVVTDLVMEGRRDGLELLKKIKQIDPPPPVILVTAHGDIRTAVQAMDEGAYSFIEKPLDLEHFRAQVNRAVERSQLQKQNEALREQLVDVSGFEGVIGTSPAMRKVIQTARQVAPSDIAVLITGESGTGKELIARAIHNNSRRRKGRLVAMNCAGFSPTILEDELFGHVRGAFTDAKSDRAGAFEVADGGTLFLDEVGNMPLPQQAKLLRVLQTGEFNPVGSSKVKKSDVRVIAATNARLADEVSQGRFREDLLYRLNTVEIQLPPLRERTEDIPSLAQHFLGVQAQRYGKKVTAFSRDALEALVRHPWPGNVRELEHAVERAVLMARDSQIAAEDLVLAPAARRESAQLYEAMTLDEAEKVLIQKALGRCGGNVTDAARELGVSRSALYRRLQHHGLKAQG